MEKPLRRLYPVGARRRRSYLSAIAAGTCTAPVARVRRVASIRFRLFWGAAHHLSFFEVCFAHEVSGTRMLLMIHRLY